jgi:type IV secretory pathway VirB10-like protein
VKKSIVVLLAALTVAAAGCQKQEEIGKAPAPSAAVKSGAPQPTAPQAVEPKAAEPQATPQTAAPHPSVGAPPAGGDPHAGLRLKETPAGAGRKGKVLQTMDAGSYTYLEVEEKGQKLWIAALKIKLSKGDIVEFPDSKPIEKFESKTLKRTFDKIIFAESIRVVK